jgi:SEC-C motif-containing protein
MTICPCGSGKQFDTCCGPIIAGQPAPTPEALMRSRYVAFTLGDLDHIERTNTGNALASFNRADMEASLPGTEWTGFDILDTEGGQKGDSEGKVKFSFRYRSGGRDYSQLEIASFQRTGDVWLYDDSEVNPKPPPVRVEKVGRNDPCTCGSGKKYKKCCGA